MEQSSLSLPKGTLVRRPDEQPLVDSDRTASAEDQTASDSDQTASDSDQTASDGDQTASEEDQIASDQESARGSGHLDGGTARRDRATHLRDQQARARLATASERDITADRRARLASTRDQVAETRDASAETQDRSAESAELGRQEDQALRAGKDRRRAAADRASAADDRARAAEERAQAAHDRKLAASDRDRAAADREVSEIDELTHVRRRGAGMAQLQREIDRARRAAANLVVAFLDVDGLKLVNDTQGHLAGDALLCAVAESLRACLRSYDLLMRFGGDEFVCAMPSADIDNVRERFGEVSNALAARPCRGSFTVGFAELREKDSPEDLIGRADADLLARRGPS
jgi:diguanylate cyclase (GGDEF)-like protein